MTRFTESEAAAYLRIDEKTLLQARYRHKVTYRKLGKQVIYTKEDLDAYDADCTKPARKDACEADTNSPKEQDHRSGILPGPWEGSRFVEAQTQKIINSLNKS